MNNVRPTTVSSASRAFSSLAVTVAMAVLTILALAFGTLQDSKADAELRAEVGDVATIR